ncbi:26S proteasome non-ATPase regulatory subunit 3 [Histoplasma capsulatum]|uniref:26S proteasome non-ATPase regulatory subunit 3 n=1 Tax=Ajellomyces capsulatus TaxID=5037 RepID=A0A8A1M4C2_AJECA|nr:26S proteasome non-ATPase regulatory subunit 3 [Histoplasma capsulatum]
MPAERRSLRSNKSDTSANGEKHRSNSTSQNSKDKPAPPSTRSSARGKTAAASGKKTSSSNTASSTSTPTSTSASTSAAKKMVAENDQTAPHTNGGSDPVENGVNNVNGTEDVEMAEDDADINGSATQKNHREGGGEPDDGMTVVVPPSKGSRLSGEPEQNQHDITMNEVEDGDAAELEVQVDPREKALSETYQPSDSTASFLLASIGKKSAFADAAADLPMDVDGESRYHGKGTATRDVLPEVDIYLAILIQIYLYDKKDIEQGANFSSSLVELVRSHNRRTLDSLAARVYFYYSLFYEQLAPLPPSPAAAVISIRQPLLQALRTSVLRKDQDIQATITTLLLRNYLSTSHISQADLFVSRSEFPPGAPNNQIARYLYYLGRIRAIQLQYTEAHEHLIGATRKSPSSHTAGGFYQASTKLLVVVELLMGDIPDRAIFRQATLERAMHPYFLLVQAVSIGDLDGFIGIVQKHSSTFRRDGTYTLILRLRQNVIKTGIRMMSLAYTRISLRDICLRLGLDSEESAEYIVAKAIRDGVIEASLDHEHGYMKSKEVGDVYATGEPGEVFHERIRFCLDLHDESVKAMRFPMNQHRLELKNAQEARERERELAKEIVEGDLDDDDAGGDFDTI